MTREKAIEILKRKTTIPNDGEDFYDISDAFDMAIEALSSSENPNKWIPVTERLPEKEKDVLVWYEYFRYGNYNRMYQTYGIGYQYNGFWGGDVSGTNARCIAWMPLPEPYKEIQTGAEGSEE